MNQNSLNVYISAFSFFPHICPANYFRINLLIFISFVPMIFILDARVPSDPPPKKRKDLVFSRFDSKKSEAIGKSAKS